MSAALLALAAPTPGAGVQINVESLRGSDREAGAAASLELDVALLSGNVDLKSVGLDGRGDYVAPSMTAFLVLQGNVGWKDGKRFRNQAVAHARGARPAGGRVWMEAFVQTEFNKQRRLSSRFLVGGGPRLQVVRRTKGVIWWGTALMLERETLEPLADAAPPPPTRVYRWSNYLTGRLELREGVRATGTAYLQPRLGDLGDVRVLSEVRMSVSVTSSWSFETSYRMRYDSEPPLETKAVDAELRTGLLVRF